MLVLERSLTGALEVKIPFKASAQANEDDRVIFTYRLESEEQQSALKTSREFCFMFFAGPEDQEPMPNKLSVKDIASSCVIDSSVHHQLESEAARGDDYVQRQHEK